MWTVLRSIKDWEAYQQQTSQALGIAGVPVAWGNGPKEYPCLITTYMPPVSANQPPKLVSAYVYTSDAEALFKASGVRYSKPGGGGEKPLHPDQPRQGDFNRWVTAYLLGLTRELREVGALKPAPFEQSLMEALSLVDEVATEKKDQIMAQLDKQDKALLDRLYPEG